MQTYGNRLFSVAASVQRNQLPDCIRRQESMAAFKVSLKTHLFRISYGIQSKNVILINDFSRF